MFTVEEPRNKERLESEIPVRTGFIPARRAYLNFSSLMSCVILFKYSYKYMYTFLNILYSWSIRSVCVTVDSGSGPPPWSRPYIGPTTLLYGKNGRYIHTGTYIQTNEQTNIQTNIQTYRSILTWLGERNVHLNGIYTMTYKARGRSIFEVILVRTS